MGIAFILPMINRGEIRAKYHLEGSACKDCLCALCCTPCDITQQEKEVEYREKQPMLTEQPGKVENMQYSQQQQQPQFHHG